jgi:hypothetical protein
MGRRGKRWKEVGGVLAVPEALEVPAWHGSLIDSVWSAVSMVSDKWFIFAGLPWCRRNN